MVEKYQYLVGATGLLAAAAFLLRHGFPLAKLAWQMRAISRTTMGWQTAAFLVGGGAACLLLGTIFLLFGVGLIAPAQAKPTGTDEFNLTEVLFGLVTFLAGGGLMAISVKIESRQKRMKQEPGSAVAWLFYGGAVVAFVGFVLWMAGGGCPDCSS